MHLSGHLIDVHARRTYPAAVHVADGRICGCPVEHVRTNDLEEARCAVSDVDAKGFASGEVVARTDGELFSKANVEGTGIFEGIAFWLRMVDTRR